MKRSAALLALLAIVSACSKPKPGAISGGQPGQDQIKEASPRDTFLDKAMALAKAQLADKLTFADDGTAYAVQAPNMTPLRPKCIREYEDVTFTWEQVSHGKEADGGLTGDQSLDNVTATARLLVSCQRSRPYYIEAKAARKWPGKGLPADPILQGWNDWDPGGTMTQFDFEEKDGAITVKRVRSRGALLLPGRRLPLPDGCLKGAAEYYITSLTSETWEKLEHMPLLPD